MVNKLQHIADRIVQRYFLPFSLTMLIHLLFFGILIVLEMSKPDKPQENYIMIDFTQEEEFLLKQLEQKNNQQEIEEFKTDDIRNVEKNLAEKNASDKDYYREAKELIKSAQGKEVFKANDYKDLRWLIKDYSLETPDITDWNKPINENNLENKNTQATYSGNAIISYDLGGRRAVRLPIPAYKCIGHGKVIIEIMVNPKGYVTSARITETSTSLSETCLPQSAIEAAKRSKFLPSENAPAQQKGYIYYTFIAQ